MTHRQLDPEHRTWIALGVLALGLSMVVLDGTIVAVAIPAIIRDLGLGLTQAQWINTIYAVVLAALLITIGRLGDRFGRRTILIAGVLVFIVGSLIAACAGSAGPLILGRIVQGIGAAAVMPGALATMNTLFRGRGRITAFAVGVVIIAAVAALGPLLGGWLTTYFTWPWVFLIEILLGVVVLAGLVLFVPETRADTTARGLDVDGLLLSAAGLALLAFGLIEGQTYGWWKPLREFPLAGFTWQRSWPISPIPVLLLLGVLALALFVRWEQHRVLVARPALIEPGMFRIPGFLWGAVTIVMIGLGAFGLLFVLPLFLVNVLGLSTLGAGYVLTAMTVGVLAAAFLSERFAGRYGSVRIVRIGLALQAIAIALTALFTTAHISGWWLALLLACYGIGVGLAAEQLTGIMSADALSRRDGQDSAVQGTGWQIGSAFGTAILGALLAGALAHDLPSRLKPTGLSTEASGTIATATRESAGDAISRVREHGGVPAVLDALTRGFTDSTRTALLAVTIILFLGFAATTRIPDRPAAEEDETAVE